MQETKAEQLLAEYSVKLLYLDNHLLAVQKPPGLPVQADSSRDRALLEILKEYLKIRYQKPGNVFLAPAHRLDRPTGGLILFARTSKAASRMADIFRRHAVQKEYLVVVEGCPEKKRGRLVHYLIKDHGQNQVSVSEAGPAEQSSSGKKAGQSKAKKAILEYELLDSNVEENKQPKKENSGKLSLLRVRLHTGRSHQIRVQCQAAGLPVFGDNKYGRKAASGTMTTNLGLWSTLLVFEHPVQHRELHLETRPPALFPWDRFVIP